MKKMKNTPLSIQKKYEKEELVYIVKFGKQTIRFNERADAGEVQMAMKEIEKLIERANNYLYQLSNKLDAPKSYGISKIDIKDHKYDDETRLVSIIGFSTRFVNTPCNATMKVILNNAMNQGTLLYENDEYPKFKLDDFKNAIYEAYENLIDLLPSYASGIIKAQQAYETAQQ
jgi:hypothetical protein